jgi:hypothetical protein
MYMKIYMYRMADNFHGMFIFGVDLAVTMISINEKKLLRAFPDSS